MVFYDPTPAQPTPSHTQSTLRAYGTADFVLQGRTMAATATLTGVPDAATELVVTTTVVGNEVVPCFEGGGAAYCIGALIGDPLVGGMTLLGSANSVFSRGPIALATLK